MKRVLIILLILFPTLVLAETTENCNAIFTQEAFDLLREVLEWFYILAPVILIALIAADLSTAVMSQDDKVMQKIKANLVKRIIAAMCLFLVPFFINILLGLPGIQESLGDIGLLDQKACANKNNYVAVNLEPKTATSKSVEIILTPDFEYDEVELPDKTKVKYQKEIKYSVDKNGTYIFTFYTSDNMLSIQKNVPVNNIDKDIPTGNCTYKNGIITINAKDTSGIAGYSYYNGSKYSEYIANNTSAVGGNIQNPKVRVKDNAGNITELVCDKSANTSEGDTNYISQSHVDSTNEVDLSSYHGYMNNYSMFYLTNYDDRNSSTFQNVHGIDLHKYMKIDSKYGWWTWENKVVVAAATTNLANSSSNYTTHKGIYYFTLPPSGTMDINKYPQAYMFFDNKWFEVVVIDSCGGCMIGETKDSKTYQQFDVLMDYDSDTSDQRNYMKNKYSKYQVFLDVFTVKTVLIK